jgi:hypothetical protein
MKKEAVLKAQKKSDCHCGLDPQRRSPQRS